VQLCSQPSGQVDRARTIEFGLLVGRLGLILPLTADGLPVCTAATVRCLAQVAAGIVRGSARGDYHIRGPDVGLNILVASMAGFSPRMYNWVFEVNHTTAIHPAIDCMCNQQTP
jgi:hypothetical protein